MAADDLIRSTGELQVVVTEELRKALASLQDEKLALKMTEELANDYLPAILEGVDTRLPTLAEARDVPTSKAEAELTAEQIQILSSLGLPLYTRSTGETYAGQLEIDPDPLLVLRSKILAGFISFSVAFQMLKTRFGENVDLSKKASPEVKAWFATAQGWLTSTLVYAYNSTSDKRTAEAVVRNLSNAILEGVKGVQEMIIPKAIVPQNYYIFSRDGAMAEFSAVMYYAQERRIAVQLPGPKDDLNGIDLVADGFDIQVKTSGALNELPLVDQILVRRLPQDAAGILRVKGEIQTKRAFSALSKPQRERILDLFDVLVAKAEKSPSSREIELVIISPNYILNQ